MPMRLSAVRTLQRRFHARRIASLRRLYARRYYRSPMRYRTRMYSRGLRRVPSYYWRNRSRYRR